MLYKCCRILHIRLLQAFLLMVLKSFDSWMLQGLPCYICSWQCAFVHKYGINYSSTQHSEEGKGNSRSINQSIFNRSRSTLFTEAPVPSLHPMPQVAVTNIAVSLMRDCARAFDLWFCETTLDAQTGPAARFIMIIIIHQDQVSRFQSCVLFC